MEGGWRCGGGVGGVVVWWSGKWVCGSVCVWVWWCVGGWVAVWSVVWFVVWCVVWCVFLGTLSASCVRWSSSHSVPINEVLGLFLSACRICLLALAV